MIRLFFVLIWFSTTAVLVADERVALPRCALVPQPGHQVSFRIDGIEKTRWHFGAEYPRPFFYPFLGPSGVSLTRMGHPGAPNHDHHRSVWLGHRRVNDQDFWSEASKTRIRQRTWQAYRDGDDEAIMAVRCGWYDQNEKEVMEQDVVASLFPLAQGEHALEIQITMRPARTVRTVELGRTPFGFLAVRVAKSISAYFGWGKLTSSEGQQGELKILGKPARWIDYSGPVGVGRGPDRKARVEGITYFDHPNNPRYPTPWHVREDGWMGASLCTYEGFLVTSERPLTLRYLLHAHSGPYDRARARSVHRDFAARPGFEVTKATDRHRQYEVKRKTEE